MANGNTYNKELYVYNNKRKAISDIRSIVRGNHYQQKGNVSFYEVKDESGEVVAAGSLHDDTMWWRRTI